MIGISDTSNTPITPFDFDVFNCPPVKGIELGSIILAIMIQPLKQILYRRIFGLVTNQNNRITFKEMPNEVCRPPLGKIGSPEIGAT